MGTLDEKLARLRNFNAWVRHTDPQLAEEMADSRPPLTAFESMPSVEASVGLESIVLRRSARCLRS